MTCRLFQSHLNLQSQCKNLPPSDKPRRVRFKCENAFSGTLFRGFPSNANKVTVGFPKR